MTTTLRFSNLKSIRWRLPLSYGAIALLTAVLLGSILLTSLRHYYAGLEHDYLQYNASTIGLMVQDMLRRGIESNTLQAQFTSFGFLSQARVQYISLDGQTRADSGAVQMARPISIQAVALPEVHQNLDFTAAATPWLPGEQVSLLIFENQDIDTQTTRRFTFSCPTQLSTVPAAGCVLQSGKTTASVVTQTQPQPQGPDFVLSVAPTLYGYELSRDVEARSGVFPQTDTWIQSLTPGAGAAAINADESTVFWLNSSMSTASYSDQVAEYPLYDLSNEPLGVVKLSDGPAYGTEIVNSVARGYILASLGAVTLAAFGGWLISRNISVPVLTLSAVTTRMAEGDLSARVKIQRNDEIGALADAFNEMAERVEDTVITLRRFLADAAHELNTPLTALRTNLEIAAEQRTTAPPNLVIERAQSQVKRLEDLTSGLLQLSRIEAGNLDEKQMPLDAVSLAHEMSEFYASQAEMAGVSLATHFPQRAINIIGDGTQLRYALGSLIENAIKFTPREGEIIVGVYDQSNIVEIFVEDTGIGISADEAPFLFDRFYRGRNANKYPGSGLGLAIVRAIAEHHRGQAQVTAKALGARFALRLPGVPRSSPG